MASWQYAFLFPGPNNRLRPASAVGCLARAGFEFDSAIRLCLPIDNESHLLDVGEEVALQPPILDDLTQRLEQGVSLSVQAGSSDLAVSCQFNTASANPHISFGWSRRLFGALSGGSRRAFWVALRWLARDCQAAYVIVIDDAPDNFEDRFVEIGNARMLDMCVDHPYGLAIRQVWLNELLVRTPPDGPAYGDSEEMGDGFRRYSVRGMKLGRD
jgi:hypothetical protein